MPRRQHFRAPRVGRYLPPLGNDFVSVEALSGVALLLTAVAALVWANVDASSYGDVWEHVLTVGIGDGSISLDARHWINDGLMTVFFFVVGLEIKRELVEGELRDPKTATVPVIAALGGMAVPALLFVAFNAGGAGARGWGIPMATDIAFAIGVLAVLGTRVSSGAKLFLLTLAIVDDIGAILVIAIFYSGGIDWTWLAGALGVLGLVLVLRRVRASSPLFVLFPALALWVCMHESGVHATIAGVILGLLIPVAPGSARGPLERFEHALHPWSSFVIIPLFALANAGVALTGETISGASSSAIAAGVAIGLVVGKPVGIVGATALALRMRGAKLPGGMRASDVISVGLVAGIGFTVSLFVASLSFTGTQLEEAKVAILLASALAGTAGALACVVTARRPRRTEQDSTR